MAYFRSDNACSSPDRGTPAHPVKAIVYCDYGLADVLKLEDIEKPVPEAGQILVKVRAAAANPLDWHMMRGTPYVMRFGTGLRRPTELRLGVDYAGVVESVGPGVTQFKPGDEVFGARTGAFGEVRRGESRRKRRAEAREYQLRAGGGGAGRGDHGAAGPARGRRRRGHRTC